MFAIDGDVYNDNKLWMFTTKTLNTNKLGSKKLSQKFK